MLTFWAVDAAGAPIPGVKTAGETTKTSFMTLTSSYGKFKAETDKNGEASTALNNQVIYLEFKKEGYYPIQRSFITRDPPNAFAVVKLDQLELAVDMVGGKVNLESIDRAQIIEFGVAIDDSNDQPVLTTADRPKCGLWIRLSRSEPYHDELPSKFDRFIDRLWTIQFIGQNGWQLAVGPQDGENIDHIGMRVAPELGYQDNLSLTAVELPAGYFLRNQLDGRYGKLFGVTFRDENHPAVRKTWMKLNYLVQSKPVKSNSLNPTQDDKIGK